MTLSFAQIFTAITEDLRLMVNQDGKGITAMHNTWSAWINQSDFDPHSVWDHFENHKSKWERGVQSAWKTTCKHDRKMHVIDCNYRQLQHPIWDYNKGQSEEYMERQPNWSQDWCNLTFTLQIYSVNTPFHVKLVRLPWTFLSRIWSSRGQIRGLGCSLGRANIPVPSVSSLFAPPHPQWLQLLQVQLLLLVPQEPFQLQNWGNNL